MKNLLTLLIVFSSFIAAEEYKYEPVANKAEYYSGQFNKGKDMDDLLSWGEKFAEWMVSPTILLVLKGLRQKKVLKHFDYQFYKKHILKNHTSQKTQILNFHSHLF